MNNTNEKREENIKEIKITDIEGFKIGNAENKEGATGCTAIICEKGAAAGVDVRGGGPAARETELLKPVNMAQKIHCVMLSGGSAYGLAAGDGAMKFLEERNIGFDVGIGIVPLVCGSSLFDLVVGDPKCRPDREMGYEACSNAFEGEKLCMGNFGAGTGASVGKFLGIERMMKSGLGSYAVQIGNIKVGAIVAVNALGDIFHHETGAQIAGILSQDKTHLVSTRELMYRELGQNRNVFSGNTTIGCIITNAKLTKDQCNKLAQMTHNGYARTIRPVHTSADGDSIYLMASGEYDVNPDALGTLCADVMARAVNNALFSAEAAYGLKCAKDFL